MYVHISLVIHHYKLIHLVVHVKCIIKLLLKPHGKWNLGDLSIDGRTVLKCI
jgi:hypothetical protein